MRIVEIEIWNEIQNAPNKRFLQILILDLQHDLQRVSNYVFGDEHKIKIKKIYTLVSLGWS